MPPLKMGIISLFNTTPSPLLIEGGWYKSPPLEDLGGKK